MNVDKRHLEEPWVTIREPALKRRLATCFLAGVVIGIYLGMILASIINAA